jgi:putative transposase
MSYRKTAHSVYDLKYHIVWVTKYRKPILHGEIGLRLRELIRQSCARMDVYILAGHVSKDHVHLLVSVPPKVSVSDLVQQLKGRSSRRLLDEFGELKRQYWGRHLWARGYFAVTTGNVTDEMVKEYIESHHYLYRHVVCTPVWVNVCYSATTHEFSGISSLSPTNSAMIGPAFCNVQRNASWLTRSASSSSPSRMASNSVL